MKRSWRKIIDVLASGGTLWAGGSPRKRAHLCPENGKESRVVRLSTIVDMEAEGLLEDQGPRGDPATDFRVPDDYWNLTDKAKELVWPK